MSTALARSPTATTSWWSTLAFLTTRFPLGVAGGVILLVFVFAAVFAGVIAPLDPFSTNAAARLAPPGGTHLMGADAMGRDVFSRMMHGARISLAVALGATAIGSGMGTAIGLVSGYVGGWFDLVVQRLAEIMQALPPSGGRWKLRAARC